MCRWSTSFHRTSWRSCGRIRTSRGVEAEILTLVYIALDSARDKAPLLTDVDGKPLDSNPLKDVRVRRALSTMIDRTRLVIGGARRGRHAGRANSCRQACTVMSRSLQATAIRSGRRQEAAGGCRAGPRGFGVSLYGSNDRFPAGCQRAAGGCADVGARRHQGQRGQAAALQRVRQERDAGRVFGVPVQLRLDHGRGLGRASTACCIPSTMQAGLGGLNRTKYSNKCYDVVLGKGLAEFDPAKREAHAARGDEDRVRGRRDHSAVLAEARLGGAQRRQLHIPTDDRTHVASNVKKQ